MNEPPRSSLTRLDLIEQIAQVTELPKQDAKIILETICDAMARAIHAGDRIEIRGFGSFRSRVRGPRLGRNPKTGVPVQVPAKPVPYFHPSRARAALVNPITLKRAKDADGLTRQLHSLHWTHSWVYACGSNSIGVPGRRGYRPFPQMVSARRVRQYPLS